MKFESKQKAKSGIPLSSLPDIVFLLLIFFMVSSVFKEFSGLPVRLPSARKIEKLQGKRDVAYLWISKDGTVSIDDKFVDMNDISKIMYQKRIDPLHPLKLVSMKIDKDTKMGDVTDVQEELREADALNINYSAKPAF
ncbi:biopolymer transporter ExbD [candidate division KSB1 bacterium]|nr:biopolymer transporter ExbD [candidate division KSB1 bacterium]NIR71028.1 biopolymer transporter ExbD [candidate division KSB1 bacterium]NIS26113.1 biopolymer transporter ExbD [candidate division KSB1 bacterium]NIT72907.1 biopolymer transporter ExbD [candidate division KSB1 bacterium]NIU26752.1 biopolymer transporter ExbD [candidate division KSB1 bacterium]